MAVNEKFAVSIYEYQCRRCHEIQTTSIENGFAELVLTMYNLNKTDKEMKEDLKDFNEQKKDEEELLTDKPNLFNVHICEDGGKGLSDLIGCEPAREVTVSKGKWRGQYRHLEKCNFTGRQKESPYHGWFH